MKPVLFALVLTALPGCALLQKSQDDDGTRMMMTADIVPLVSDEQSHTRGKPMPVPQEPSPFEGGKGRPAAMQSDLDTSRPKVKTDDEALPIPREPIP